MHPALSAAVHLLWNIPGRLVVAIWARVRTRAVDLRDPRRRRTWAAATETDAGGAVAVPVHLLWRGAVGACGSVPVISSSATDQKPGEACDQRESNYASHYATCYGARAAAASLGRWIWRSRLRRCRDSAVSPATAVVVTTTFSWVFDQGELLN